MLKKLELSASQHQGWDSLLDGRAVVESREKRFLKDCLLELGGALNQPWQFDEATRQFWMNVPDDETRMAENLPATVGGPATGEN